MKKRHTIGAIAGVVIIVGVIDIYRGRLEAAKKELPWGMQIEEESDTTAP